MLLLLLMLVFLLIPTTTASLHTTSQIVNPSPNPLSRTRSFTAMSKNITSITSVNFGFRPHHSPRLAYLDTTLNNVYSDFEPFEDVTLASLFTDTNCCTAFNANAINLLRSMILAIAVNNSRADQPTIEPLLNNMPLSTRAGSPKAQFNIRGPSTPALAFQAQIVSHNKDITIILNVVSIFCSSWLELGWSA